MLKRRIRSLLLLALLLCLCVTAVSAMSPVPEQANLNIQYLCGKVPVTGAEFRIYRVASFDRQLNETFVSEDYADCRIDLNVPLDGSWDAVALAMQGYVESKGIRPDFTEDTGAEGILTLENIPSGLYLLCPRICELDGYVYTGTPALVPVPYPVQELGKWDNDMVILPKCSREPLPDEPQISRTEVTVLKEWKDEGHTEARPQSITVNLLRDGEVYDTATLPDADGTWRHVWKNLRVFDEQDHKIAWTVSEAVVPASYTVTVSAAATRTYVICNTYRETPPPPEEPDQPYASVRIPVIKRVVSEATAPEARFTFTLSPKEAKNPMPAASSVSINGAGQTAFDSIYFTVPGEYIYTVSELDTGVTGYTYDTSIFTVRIVVTRASADKLECEITVTDEDGAAVDAADFTNVFTPEPPGPPELPQTGLLWWPVPLLLCAGLLALCIGVVRRRRQA